MSKKKPPHTVLKDARIKLGHRSQSAAARVLGMPLSTYSADENGSREISRERMRRYSETFKINWAEHGYEGFDPIGIMDVPRNFLVDIPVVGVCAEGNWRVSIMADKAEWFKITVPRIPPMALTGIEGVVGFEIRDSKSPYPKQSIAVCATYTALREAPESGDKVMVIRRKDGFYELTCKTISYENDVWTANGDPILVSDIYAKVLAVWIGTV